MDKSLDLMTRVMTLPTLLRKLNEAKSVAGKIRLLLYMSIPLVAVADIQGWEVSRYSLGRAWIEAILWLGVRDTLFWYLP